MRPIVTLDRDAPNARIVVAITERARIVTPTAGENAGATLRHDAAVRAFATIDAEREGIVELSHPDDLVPAGATVVAFVQEAPQGRVLGAAAAPSP